MTPADTHEWFSFQEPGFERTYMVDITFLRSNWTCIYGQGCQGVLTGPAAEMEQGCCSYGAHFVDGDDVATVEAVVGRLTPDQWQFAKRGRTPRKDGSPGWLKTDKQGTQTTRLVDDACIFLNRPGFAGGAGCALHVGAVAAGESYINWKPGVCWQLPLRLEENTDGEGHVTSILREWKRRDWGDGGTDFHWWCTDSDAAFVGDRSVYHTMRDEIVELVGQVAYDIIGEYLARPTVTPLPHPAVRRE